MATSHVKTRIKIKDKPDPNVTWRYFDSDLVDRMNDKKEVHVDPVTGWSAGQGKLEAGEFTFHLARKFGFCYGVKLAIWDSLSALDRHHGKRILALSEMIHNPAVNDELVRRGTVFMDRAGLELRDIGPEDVVIIPAFGTTTDNFAQLKALADTGATLIDTTCRSVIDVWDQIVEYNQAGLTSIIHGKYEHEETIATASYADRYLIVRDIEEAAQVCEYLRSSWSADELLARFSNAVSAGFDPARDLQRIGMANQTTMRSSESEEVFALFRETMSDIHGADDLDGHYRGLDTICRATEVRQQAVIDMVRDQPLDLMIVIGGFNSSNTKNLAKIASGYVKTYHIDGEWAFDGEQIRHLVYGASEPIVDRDWLPDGGHVGITAGASTPDNSIGQTISKILGLRPQTAPQS